jgi:hypothetical protein
MPDDRPPGPPARKGCVGSGFFGISRKKRGFAADVRIENVLPGKSAIAADGRQEVESERKRHSSCAEA